MYKILHWMHTEESTQKLLALSMIPGVGPATARRILNEFENLDEFFSQATRIRIPGVRPNDLSDHAIRSYLIRAKDEINYNERLGINTLNIQNQDYPNRLRNCEDAPLVIFTRGNLDLNTRRIVGIVGTRKASPYGMRICEELISELETHKCDLVSGLAIGIDSGAHRAAQGKNIQNIGVVAHGLDRLYPSSNRALAKSMEERGGLITDFTIGTRPEKMNFPKRNRLIAGLIDALIVVEAAEKGGALITADLASSYGRDVFAIPGRIGDPVSIGCNNLIRYNKAAVISKASDIAWYLGWEVPKKKPVQISLFEDLSDQELSIVKLLDSGIESIDDLAITSKFKPGDLATILLGLELKNKVLAFPGKRYKLSFSQ